MIEAIIFDLGKVLIPFDFTIAWRRLEVYGASEAEVLERAARTDLYKRFETGRISAEDFAAEFAREARIDIAFADFCSIWTSIFLTEPLVSDEFLAALARNYPLVLLSNTNVIHFEMIQENYRLLRHFKAFVLSYEAGEMKPAAAIYDKAVKATGVPAAKCLFIDDIAENVAGALSAGLDAVQFFSEERLKAELTARGLVWELPQ